MSSKVPHKEETLERLLTDRPAVHPKRDGSPRCVGLHSDVLRAVAQQIKPGDFTLETGCGLSTLVFALGGCIHKAIVPNPSHIEATKESAAAYQVPLNNVVFLEGRSEDLLPELDEAHRSDVILIDGGHAFPIPFIDWFYAGRRLKIGGLLVVDDIDLKTVSILCKFLSKQPEWQRSAIIRRTAFFRKIDEMETADVWDYWHRQPYNKYIGRSIRKLWLNLRYR
jgi:predicted O-methyltransferase YrrM